MNETETDKRRKPPERILSSLLQVKVTQGQRRWLAEKREEEDTSALVRRLIDAEMVKDKRRKQREGGQG